MKVNTIELLIIFDEQMTVTEEERGMYWYTAKRPDGIVITLSFSIYEDLAGVLLHTKDLSISIVDMKNCSEIRVLDEKKRMLEIIHADNTGRCFLDLMGKNILNYTE